MRIDIIERKIDLAFLQEIWENTSDKSLQLDFEKMLEVYGLKYISKPRKVNAKGTSYGGTAVIVNAEKFSAEELNVMAPPGIEVVWVLLKSKVSTAKFKTIITCSFYSPPVKIRIGS